MKISGVYKITNKVTGDFYIGSSKNIKKRWSEHKRPSMWKRQFNSKLYLDMAQYGLDNFSFQILEETANLRNREQYWIDQLKPSYNDKRADGQDIERYKQRHKAYYQSHKDELSAQYKIWYDINKDEQLNNMRIYRSTHRDKISIKNKAYYNKLCLYEDETLTLGALTKRFQRQRIPHATLEAKKYLI